VRWSKLIIRLPVFERTLKYRIVGLELIPSYLAQCVFALPNAVITIAIRLRLVRYYHDIRLRLDPGVD